MDQVLKWGSEELIFWDRHCSERAEGRARRLWVGTKAFLTRQRFLYRRQTLLSFRVTFIAETATSSIWLILLDPYGERPVPIVDLAKALALPRVWPIVSNTSPRRKRGWHQDRIAGRSGDTILSRPQDHTQGRGTLDGQSLRISKGSQQRWQLWENHCKWLSYDVGDYELLRLYAKACQYLQSKLPQAMKNLECETRARHDEEKSRLQEYYRQLSQEAMYPLRKLFRRLAVASVRADLARLPRTYATHVAQITSLKAEIEEIENNYRHDLEEIQQEMSWRLGELDARYATRVQVSLIGVAYIWAPYVEFAFHIPALGNEHIYLYSCVTDEFVDTFCDSCQGMVDHLTLCPCGNVVCSKCQGVCPDCTRQICCDCADGSCDVCGALVCKECSGVCPSPSILKTPSSETVICSKCREGTCNICISLTNYGLQ